MTLVKRRLSEEAGQWRMDTCLSMPEVGKSVVIVHFLIIEKNQNVSQQ